jgi:hypothetical protein
MSPGKEDHIQRDLNQKYYNNAQEYDRPAFFDEDRLLLERDAHALEE